MHNIRTHIILLYIYLDKIIVIIIIIYYFYTYNVHRWNIILFGYSHDHITANRHNAVHLCIILIMW